MKGIALGILLGIALIAVLSLASAILWSAQSSIPFRTGFTREPNYTEFMTTDRVLCIETNYGLSCNWDAYNRSHPDE